MKPKPSNSPKEDYFVTQLHPSLKKPVKLKVVGCLISMGSDVLDFHRAGFPLRSNE
jgi:hypothetical protein